MQGAKLRHAFKPWEVPVDLKPFIKSESMVRALMEMVSGSHVHIEHEKHGHTLDRASRTCAMEGTEHVIEGGERPSAQRVLKALISLFAQDKTHAIGRLRGSLAGLAKPSRTFRAVSGQRFIQMSEDLSTLRWSWYGL